MANVANITSSNPGRNGVFFRAPVGTALPTNASSDLDPLFVDQGIVGEDGVAQAITRDTEDVKAYGGDTVYTLQTDYGQEFTLTVYESTNVPTLRTVFGDSNVTETSEGLKVVHNKTRLPRSSAVFEHLIDQGVKRQVAEQAQVVSVGDIVNVHSDIVKYELTIKLYPDAEGNLLYEYYAFLDGEGPLQIVSQVITGGQVNEPYSAKLIAAGGTAPYTWAAVGALPDGLSLAEDGTLSGTPTAEGTHTVTAKATDGAGASVQKSLELKITPAAG